MHAALLQAQWGHYDQAQLTVKAIVQGDMGNGPMPTSGQVNASIAALVRNDRSLPAARREELGETYG